MKSKPTVPLAVMNVEKGEEIAGMWVTPYIPQTGFYKLLAKKKKDGTYEWAHFIQHDDGRKERVMRGKVENEAQLTEVVEIANRNLGRVFGAHIHLIPADVDVYMLDGKPAPPAIH